MTFLAGHLGGRLEEKLGFRDDSSLPEERRIASFESSAGTVASPVDKSTTGISSSGYPFNDTPHELSFVKSSASLCWDQDSCMDLGLA